MAIIPIIIQLLTGAVGGNVMGALAKNLSLGTVGNSLAGIVGGGIGGQILNMLNVGAAPSGALDLASIIGSVASGGVGGGVVMLVIGLIKKLLAK